MVDLGYAVERLRNTVVALAGWSGDVRERLRSAHQSHLSGLVHHLPEDLQRELLAIDQEFTKGQGLTEEEARTLVGKIVYFYETVVARRVAENIIEDDQRRRRPTEN